MYTKHKRRKLHVSKKEKERIHRFQTCQRSAGRYELPKQIAYEETAKMMIARQITVSMNKEMEELTNLMIKSIIRGFLDNEKKRKNR